MDWYTALVIMHIVGTVLGVGGATFVEVHLVRALRDGVMSPEESAIMQTTYMVLRVGFFLLVLSGFGFLILSRLSEYTEWFYSITFWIKLSIVGIIALNAMLIQLRLIPILWGSAVAFVSWYAALVLGIFLRGGGVEQPLSIPMIYVAAIIIVYFAMREVRRRYTQPHSPH